MSEQRLEEMIRFCSRVAQRAIRHRKSCPTFFYAFNEAGDRLGNMLHPSLDKDTIAYLLQSYFGHERVERYVYCTEAWQVDELEPTNVERVIELAARGRLRDHPACVEVVTFQGEDRDAGMRTAYRRIVRASRYDVTLGPLIIEKPALMHQGRMVGLLQPREGERMN